MLTVGGFTPPKKVTNWDCCIVKNCHSRANRNFDLSFHHFPGPNKRFVYKQDTYGNLEKVDLCTAWKTALKINTDITKRMKVCSLHFKKTDYLFPEVEAKTRFLKKIAVPSCNLPGDGEGKNDEQQNAARFVRRRSRNTKNKIINENKIHVPPIQILVPVMQQVLSVDSNIGQYSISIEKNKNNTQAANLRDDKLENEEIHEEIVYVVENKICGNSPETVTQSFLEDNLDTPATVKSKPLVKDQEVQVNTDCLVPSIMRSLQTDHQLNAVTGLETFELLDTIVEIVKKVCDDKFEQLNVIMNTKDRLIMTYAKLKHNLSHSLLAVLFNCYTEKHCQRIFHEMIKILCKGLKTELEDCGLKIDEVCAFNKWKCIKPPLFKGRKKFTTEGNKKTSKDDKSYEHIDRANQRLKTFKIVGSAMPATLAEEIITVIYCTLSLSSRTFNDANSTIVL